MNAFLLLTLLVAQTPKPPALVFPPDVAPAPPPVPLVGPAQIDSSMLYVVRANVDGVVMVASPEGVLKITKDSGPLKVRARFYGGDGTYQTTTFAEKWIYSVEGVGKGTAELIVVNGEQVIRRTIQVTDGPPGPTPGPPPPDPLTKALQAAYDADTFAGKAKHLADLTSVYRNADLGSLSTYGGLFSAMQKVEAALGLKASDMPWLHAALKKELDSALGTVKTTDPLDKAKVTAEFAKIATALGSVK